MTTAAWDPETSRGPTDGQRIRLDVSADTLLNDAESLLRTMVSASR